MSKNKCEWEWKKLGDVCEFNRGLTYSKKDEVEHSSNCILRSNNIDLDSNSLCLDELKYINDDFEIPTSKYVKSDCILICMSNGSKSHLGKVAYIDQHYGYAFGGFMGLLCPSSRISGKFLHKILSTPAYKEYIKSLSDGANINNLKYDDLKEFEIPVPPLAEQERIVKVLDDAFAKIDKIKTDAETNLQNAKDLFQTTLANELSITDDKVKEGWEEVVLDNIVRFTRGPFGGSLKKSCFKKQGYAVYEQQHAIHKHINIRYFIDGDKYQSMSRFAVQSGDLIMSCSGTMGEIFVIPEYAPKGIINQALLKFEIKNDEQREYVVRLLSSSFFKEIMSRNSQGAAIKNVASVAVLKTLKIPLPPLSIQKQIVAKLDSLSEKVKQLESNYKQVIADCDELKKSILKKAFEGNL